MIDRAAEGPRDGFVRLATIDDGQAIGEVHAASWQSGFGHMLDLEFLERAAAGRRNGWQYAIAHLLEQSNLLLVAGRDERVLAFSQSGLPDEGGADREIFAFYCHPLAWGTGLSDALMRETCDVRSVAASRTVLWTPEQAHRAQHFYERCGFARTGRTRNEALSDWQRTPAHQEVQAVEYARDLNRGRP